ncbi:MAG: Tn7-like element transposition protein TnsE, partial [Sinobacterium sp.]
NTLIEEHDCILIRHWLKKLPWEGDGKKHRLVDTQNPRCLAMVELKFNKKFYTLLEVDTSDGAAKLSTMLLKAPLGWVKSNEEIILKKIMKKSLGWPSDYFKEILGDKTCSGIPHPKSKHAGVLSPKDFGPWAQRVTNWMRRTI